MNKRLLLNIVKNKLNMSEDSTIVEVLLALLKRDSRYIQFVQEIVFKDLIGNSEIYLGNILNSEEEKREILLNICAFNCYFLLSLESIEHYYIKDEKFLLDILLKSKSISGTATNQFKLFPKEFKDDPNFLAKSIKIDEAIAFLGENVKFYDKPVVKNAINDDSDNLSYWILKLLLKEERNKAKIKKLKNAQKSATSDEEQEYYSKILEGCYYDSLIYRKQCEFIKSFPNFKICTNYPKRIV